MSGPDRSAPSRESSAPLLVGRARERALLSQALAAALSGRGSLVLIGGEAGIGKTALAEAICRMAAQQGALVLTGRCYDLTDTPPHGPWTELLGQYPPAAQPPLPAALTGPRDPAGDIQGRTAFAVRVRDFLAAVAARRPLALLLDDLHWADPASLDLLRFLARQLALHPILLMATYRTDEVTRCHPLFALLPALVREAAPLRLELLALDDGAVRTLLAARYGSFGADGARLAGYLQGRAEGNAFFIDELLRTLQEIGLVRRTGTEWAVGDLSRVGVPMLLRQVIEGRIARLGTEARHLLALAATIGQEVPLALWGEVGGIEEETLLALVERAIEARVLDASEGGATVRFHHALTRATLHEGTLPPRRTIWHRRVGEALAASAAPDPDAVAYHFRQASDPRAVVWLVMAGERAERAHAWRTAAERFDTAQALLAGSAADVRERGWLLLRRAWMRRFVDRFADPQQGLVTLAEVAQLAAAADERTLAASATFASGFLRGLGGDLRRGLADLEAGIAALDALPAAERARARSVLTVPPDQGGYHGALVRWLAYAGRYAEVAMLIDRLTDASRAGDVAYSLAFGAALMHAGLGHPDEASRSFAEARALARAADQPFYAAQAAWLELEHVTLPYRADHLAERRVLASEAEHAWEQASASQADVVPRQAQMPLLVLEGQWAEAHQLAARGPWHGPDLRARAQGNAAIAWALIRENLPEGAATEPAGTFFFPAVQYQRLAAGLALDTGDLVTARAWLEAHDRWLAWSGAVLGRSEGQALWAQLHRQAGEREVARLHADRALAWATTPRQPLALLAAQRLLGELGTQMGRTADAAAHLEAALALAEACAAPYERAQTLLALAELRAATGQRDMVRVLLDEVRAICAPLEAHLALARADELAARLLFVKPSTPALPAGLTAREVAVLRLIAAGKGNRVIAATLGVSTRTVERHIENIYGKIGAHSKAEATAFAFRHDLT